MKSILILTSLLLSFAANAADPAKTSALDPKQMEMMEKFKKYGTPGEPHKMLAGLAGTWNYNSKFWQSASAKPEESTGTTTFKMIMGGRFLQQNIKGKAMGMPWEGMGLTGYDNIKAKYQTTWIDGMGTGTMHGEGTFDTASKTLKDAGTFTCPMTQDTRNYRSEWQLTDKSNMVFAMYGPGIDDPKEFKMMEMTFKRVR